MTENLPIEPFVPGEVQVMTPRTEAEIAAEEKEIAIESGLGESAPKRIRAAAKCGRMTARVGELDYVIGNETRIVETLLAGLKLQQDILEMNRDKMTPAEIGKANECITKICETISKSQKNIVSARSLQQVAAKKANRTKSFAPDQVVHAAQQVNVNVNGATATVETKTT